MRYFMRLQAPRIRRIQDLKKLLLFKITAFVMSLAVLVPLAAGFANIQFAYAKSPNAAAIRLSALPVRSGNASISSQPEQLSQEGDVTISIRLTNTNPAPSGDDSVIDDPGQSPDVPAGSGTYTSVSISNEYGVTFNTSDVPAGETMTFTGVMHVLSSQIGTELSFTLSWIDNGEQCSEVLKIMIVRADTAYLNFKRNVSRTNAAPGEKITITYIMTNTGSVELTNIELVDRYIAGTSSPMLSAFSLLPGEKREFIYEYTMGSATVVSEPVVSFKPAGGTTELTVTVSPITLGLINAQLTKEVAISSQTPDEVILTLYLTNNGNQKLSNLSVKDELGNAVGGSSFTLAVGETRVIEYRIPNPTTLRNVVFYISGTNASGTAFSDNTQSIAVRPYIDTSLLGLKLSAAISSPMNSENVIGITFTVTNTGSVDYSNLSLKEKSIDHVLHSLDTLKPGAPIEFTVDVNTGGARDLVFVLSADDSSGNTYEFEAYVTAAMIADDAVISNEPPVDGPDISAADEGNLGGKLDGLLTDIGTKLRTWVIILGIIAAIAFIAIVILIIAERTFNKRRA